MTASLYQSGSRPKLGPRRSRVPCAGGAGLGSWTTAAMRAGMRRGRSEEVVEIALAAHPSPQPQDVRRRAVRVERDVVARPLPHEARSGQQVVRLEALIGLDAEDG